MNESLRSFPETRKEKENDDWIRKAEGAGGGWGPRRQTLALQHLCLDVGRAQATQEVTQSRLRTQGPGMTCPLGTVLHEGLQLKRL